MKKVLFATTALIATASVAAADVRLSGYGRFGLAYNERNTTTVTDPNYNGLSETNLTSRLRIQFDVSAETDGGVAFDARVRMQGENRNGVAGAMGLNAPRFGVVYNGIRVNVGNIIGAVENAPGLYTTGTRSAGTGIDGMGFKSVAIKSLGFNPVSGNFSGGTGFNWDAYSSTGTGVGNGVEVLYSAGGFTGHISYSARNGGLNTAGTAHVSGESRTGIMLTYSFGDYYVTGSYQTASNTTLLANGGSRFTVGGETFDPNDGLYFLAAGGDWGTFGARLAYGSTDIADSVTLEGNMDIGAASNVVLWVNSTDVSSTLTSIAGPTTRGTATGEIAALDGTSFGINYQYDLGGGSTFVAGYVNDAASDSSFQAGVYFSF